MRDEGRTASQRLVLDGPVSNLVAVCLIEIYPLIVPYRVEHMHFTVCAGLVGISTVASDDCVTLLDVVARLHLELFSTSVGGMRDVWYGEQALVYSFGIFL